MATAENAGAMLGEVLAAALKQQRQGGSPAAAAAAAAGTAAQEADAQLPFVEQLPPLEEVVPQEVWQPEGARSSASKQAASASSAPEVVPAQFVESQRLQQQREPVRPAAADVPLDAIDLIAAGGSLVGADPQLGRGQEEQGLEYDSEEVLAAARAALGLDSAELQRLVDDAAAKAAQAMSVPFMSSTSDAGSPAPAGAATSASKPATSSGSRKPWEAASAAPESPAAPTSGRIAQAASKGFAPAQQVSRKQAKAMRKGRAPGNSGSSERDGREGKAAAAGSSNAGQAPGGNAADASQAESPAAEPPQSSSTAPGGTTLPPVEQFVLSKAQLKMVTEKHGLDFEELLTGLQERGIPLSD